MMNQSFCPCNSTINFFEQNNHEHSSLDLLHGTSSYYYNENNDHDVNEYDTIGIAMRLLQTIKDIITDKNSGSTAAAAAAAEEEVAVVVQNGGTGTGTGGGETAHWQIIYVSLVLLYMFIALISDRIGADMVMVSSLSLLMASQIITIQEGLAGFANEGLLTVLVLFVVAAGISHTGALDWYMGKLLGRPNNTSSAQLRLMLPIAIISAFLNNTPVVVVMIPIVQRWGKNVGVSPQQLLMPLSFASILGGTCTLIGTSTNLVVVGLLQTKYPNQDISNVGLFELGKYGVPIALSGILYILIFSIFLMPDGAKFIGGKTGDTTEVPADLDESILLGARLTKWSAAANRTVKRSGLRDTAGLYLVNVHRAATGNVHRAVGQDFVLNVGDILYFTGLVEGFCEFCQENGLEVITNEVEDSMINNKQKLEKTNTNNIELKQNPMEIITTSNNSGDQTSLLFQTESNWDKELGLGINRGLSAIPEVLSDIGETKESLLQADFANKQRYINRLQDTIRGMAIEESIDGIITTKTGQMSATAPPKIVAITDKDDQQLVVIGINARDRPGLLLDVSKSLIRLGLNLHRTEALVLDGRSLSLWRCEVLQDSTSDIEEIWSVLNAMLEINSGVETLKSRGVRVIRAIVPKSSSLIGVTASDINFREKYKCAIIAIQRDGSSPAERLAQTKFAIGDILVLQTNDDSPLLIPPPQDFYKNKGNKGMPRSSSNSSIARFVRKRFGSFSSLESLQTNDDQDASSVGNGSSTRKQPVISNLEDVTIQQEGHQVQSDDVNITGNKTDEEAQNSIKEKTEQQSNYLNDVWNDLAVIFPQGAQAMNDDERNSPGNREFLTAMEISPKSGLANASVEHHGINKLPGIFLVSIERMSTDTNTRKPLMVSNDQMDGIFSPTSMDESVLSIDSPVITLSKDDPLQEGDILWFSGSAQAIGELRKIPGMKSYVNKEVKKINEKVYDRRLVQAVIARRSKLVGKTVKETRFRTRFGAAVIAVHREGKRIQEHPGKIKLQAGDVLLLEAGPSFVKQNADNDNSFSLLSEVDDSKPPRLKLLIPSLVLAVAMLAVYTAGVASLLICSLVASMIMVLVGILSQQEVRDAINWEIYVTIACAFGIGTALTNSGVAGGIADGLVALGQALNIGDAGLFGAVYFATFLISNVVTNNAAAALLFPIAMDAADTTGADKKLMSYILMLGASASFMSPFGYTTNLLIYGPGGYKYVDFLRIGTLMQIILWILSVLFVVTDPSKWYLTWIVTFTVFIGVSALLVMGSTFCNKLSSLFGTSK